VNAARAIVGEIPGIVAVSIGWSDDVASAHAQVERAHCRNGRSRYPAAHGHVWRHSHEPEPALPVSERGDRDRSEPADVDQAHEPAGGKAGPGRARWSATRARTRSTWRATSWRRSRVDPPARPRPQPPRTARARSGSLRPYREWLSVEGQRIARREDPGRQVDPRPPAPGRFARGGDSKSPPTGTTKRRLSRRSWRWSKAASGKRQ